MVEKGTVHIFNPVIRAHAKGATDPSPYPLSPKAGFETAPPAPQQSGLNTRLQARHYPEHSSALLKLTH